MPGVEGGWQSFPTVGSSARVHSAILGSGVVQSRGGEAVAGSDASVQAGDNDGFATHVACLHVAGGTSHRLRGVVEPDLGGAESSPSPCQVRRRRCA